MLHRVSVFLFVLSSTLLVGQSYQGGLRGIVSDSAGGVMAAAHVTLVDEATAVARSTTTNASGEYAFTALDPSTYVVRVEAPGFKKIEQTHVTVATQQFLSIDLKLEVGQVSESVMVTESVPLIESSNASNGQVLDHQKMTDLPNLGRNPFLLSKISQNVVPVGDPRFNRFQDQSGSSQISVAGGPVRGNNYLLDGVPITDFANRAVIIPSIEAVQEMKLQANTYDAEMGRTGGGVFNAYLKSGTNTVHGSVFGYAREGSWLANPFFFNRNPLNAGQKQDLPFRNYGASLGGPIVIPKLYNGKNRTFLWLAQEGYRQKSNLSQDLAVPTALERTGDFSQSSVTIVDPTTGAPFPGNKIPANRIDPVGLKVASYFPLPQRSAAKYGVNNYSGSDILSDRADEFTSKLDHEIAGWWRANVSYLHYGSKEPSGNLLNVLPGSQSNLLFRKVDATQVNNIFMPNPTTVISVRYGFNRFPNDVREVSAGFNPATLGFPSSYVGGIQTHAFPDFRFQNLAEVGGDASSSGVYHSKNFLTSVSKFVGRHNLKAGFDFRKINVDFVDLSDSVGVWKFDDGSTTGLKTGADLASLLLGLPSSGSVQTSTKLYTFVRYYAGYLQDDLRVNGKLTLNVGLRYEWESGLAERNNNYSVGFDPNAANPLGAPAKGALLFARQNGAPTTCCDPSKNKWSPRIGFAYALNSKTTVRGGYGTFYAPSRYELNAAYAPGYTQFTSFVASNDGGKTAANTLSNPFASGLLKPVGNTLGPLTGIGSAISVFSQNRQSPIVHQFSFDIQRELPGNVAFEVGYVASRSNHLAPSGTSAGLINVNQLDPKYFAMGTALNSAVANPFFGRGGSGAIGAATVAQYQLLLPFPEYT
ncbi:MAG: TonB-dependent receptor, partial [Acidobacteriota bacterium]|nr:TonB-dependent receptor [Acidobacteriota bacterium]